MIRTFLDSGVLISAARIDDTMGRTALAILDDADRAFCSSRYVQLEVLPKAIHGHRVTEVAFYHG